jgi:hypothetical protein
MLLGVCSSRPFPGTNANENSDLSTRPLIYRSFVEDLWRWVVFTRAFVDENVLSDLYRFEGKPRRACSPTRLPNGTVKLRRWLSS